MTKCAREFYVSATCPVSVDGFRQTFVTGASRDRGELIRFWGQKVKVQGHTIAAEAHSTRRYSILVYSKQFSSTYSIRAFLFTAMVCDDNIDVILCLYVMFSVLMVLIVLRDLIWAE